MYHKLARLAQAVFSLLKKKWKRLNNKNNPIETKTTMDARADKHVCEGVKKYSQPFLSS